MKIADKSLSQFLEEIGTKPGTPAGGSIAALSAASAAAMGEMAIHHTIKKIEGDTNLLNSLTNVAGACSKLRTEFLQDMDRDTIAYKKVVSIMKQTAETQEEKDDKKKMVEQAYKDAILIPLEITDKLEHLMKILKKVIDDGNENYLSDSVAAFLMAKSTIHSLLYHVKFNLIFIEDEEFKKEIETKVDKIESTYED